MPTGFQAFNDGGNVQIDADYRNMLLIKSGQFTASYANQAADAWYNQNIATWQNTTQYAMLAVRAVYPNKIDLSPGTWRNGMKIPSFFWPQGETSTFQYYVYDLVAPNPAHTYGMQVFNASGQLVYSALDYPLRILTDLQVGTSYTGPHANCAVMVCGGGFYVDDDGFDVETYFTRTWWSGNTLGSETVHYTNPGSGGSTNGGAWGNTSQWAMVCDVSNIPLNYSRY